MTDFFDDDIASGVPVEPGHKPVKLRVRGALQSQSFDGQPSMAPNQPEHVGSTPKSTQFLDVYRREFITDSCSSSFSVYVLARITFKDAKHAAAAELRKTKKSVKVFVKDDEVARVKLLPGFEVLDVTRSPHGFVTICAKLGDDDETEEYEVIK